MEGDVSELRRSKRNSNRAKQEEQDSRSLAPLFSLNWDANLLVLPRETEKRLKGLSSENRERRTRARKGAAERNAPAGTVSRMPLFSFKELSE